MKVLKLYNLNKTRTMNTIYKIKRFSILREEQKEFAEVNSISDLMH